MYKQHLLNSIEKEINICRRLYTKIPPDQMDYRIKEGVRSVPELLQYLGVIGATMPAYWMEKADTDFGAYYTERMTLAKSITPETFLSAMDEQWTAIKDIFSQINEEDLFNKEITYPWSGEKASLGEGIIATSVKWLAAYKLQLFLFIKLTGDQKLGTADAWVITELDQVVIGNS